MQKLSSRKIKYLLLIAILAGLYLYNNTSVFVGKFDAIHTGFIDSEKLQAIAQNNKVNIAPKGASRSVSNENFLMSFNYHLIGSNEQTSKFMVSLRSYYENLIGSSSGKVHGRGSSGSLNDLYTFKLTYERGSREGFVEARRIQIPQDHYHGDHKGTVFDFKVIAYEHQ